MLAQWVSLDLHQSFCLCRGLRGWERVRNHAGIMGHTGTPASSPSSQSLPSFLPPSNVLVLTVEGHPAAAILLACCPVWVGLSENGWILWRLNKTDLCRLSNAGDGRNCCESRRVRERETWHEWWARRSAQRECITLPWWHCWKGWPAWVFLCEVLLGQRTASSIL